MSKALACTAALIALAACSSAARAADPAAKADLTPFLAGLEKDCAAKNKKFNTALDWLRTTTGKAPAVAKAPAELRAAIGAGQVKVRDDGDSWNLTAPTTGASYRGAEVVSIDRWIGKDNGINGVSLTFAQPVGAVTKALGKFKPVKDEEGRGPELVTQKGSTRAVLVCDWSD